MQGKARTVAMTTQPKTAPKTKRSKTVTLKDNQTDQSWSFPVLEGATGPDVVDIRKFYSETGMFTYDPGFTSTGSCDSKITYIDGGKGILLHRGYPIEDLAEKCNFEEVAYLMLNGELPNSSQKRQFEHDITYHSMLHEQFHNFYSGLGAMGTLWPLCVAW